ANFLSYPLRPVAPPPVALARAGWLTAGRPAAVAHSAQRSDLQALAQRRPRDRGLQLRRPNRHGGLRRRRSSASRSRLHWDRPMAGADRPHIARSALSAPAVAEALANTATTGALR